MIDKIKKLEEELRQAMLSSNIAKLDQLISDALIFTLPDGEILTKSMDLDAYRSGLQKLTSLKCSFSSLKVTHFGGPKITHL